MVPGGIETLLRLRECMVGLGGVTPRAVEGSRQTLNLGWAAGLQGPIDLPRITASPGNQFPFGEMLQLHRVVRCVAFRSPISVDITIGDRLNGLSGCELS
nr:hypothetical protein [Mycobacterium lepraemurium]